MSTTTQIPDTCFTNYIRLYSQFKTRLTYSRFAFWTNDACKVLESMCVCVQTPPEPKYTFGPRQKKTLTFSAQTHGFSIFPEVFETFLRFSTWKWGDPTQRQINSCTCLPARAVATSSVSSYSTKNCMQSAKKNTGLATVALYLASTRTFGTLGDSPSLPWSLAASAHLLQGCPSIISGLGKDLRSATVAIAVEPSPRWICCCFSCCLAARRCSPLTSSSALSDILSATM